jgi:pilus assembly protein CpaB
MNAKTIVPLVIALILGVVAAKVGRDMIVKRRADEAKVKMVRVVMATEDLPPGSVLEGEHLAVGSIPEDGATPGISRFTFSKPSELVGRVVMTQVVKGQPVLETLLAPKGSGGGAQAMIPEGMRAVTLEVNEYNGVAGLLLPGCQVDVVHTLKFRDGSDAGLISKTIVENLRVLAVGRRTSTVGSNNPKSPEPDQQVRSVTVLVTQEQAELIDLVSHVGQPRLVLRNGLDKRVSGSKGVTLAELRGRGGDSPRPDSLTGFVQTMLGNMPPTSRPADPPPFKLNPEHATTAAPNWRNVEVIRAGTSSTVRVNAPPGAELTGNQDKLQGAFPDSGGDDE